jgi:NAD-dependent deacetylase
MNILFLTGAGVSAESGLSTFRDSDGLWNNYKIEDVCTPKALRETPELVHEFYNKRRKEVQTVEPNPAHYAIKELEQYHDVTVITSNVDNLHERAGSTRVIHLHGELLKARDMVTGFVYDWNDDMFVGTLSEQGNQLRPHIVFFHEDVTEFHSVYDMIKQEQFDYLVVVGTSLSVYPAASLVDAVSKDCKILLVDPNKPEHVYNEFEFFQGKAGEQVPLIVNNIFKKMER